MNGCLKVWRRHSRFHTAQNTNRCKCPDSPHQWTTDRAMSILFLLSLSLCLSLSVCLSVCLLSPRLVLNPLLKPCFFSAVGLISSCHSCSYAFREVFRSAKIMGPPPCVSLSVCLFFLSFFLFHTYIYFFFPLRFF